MNSKKTLWIFSLCAMVTLFAACTDIRFDNPIDINGDDANKVNWLKKHPDALDDPDTNGIANYFQHPEEYQPVDSTSPRIEILGGDTVELPLNDPNGLLAYYLNPDRVKCTDPDGSTPTLLEPTHNVNVFNEGGPYTIQYTATDASGNQGTATRYVYVVKQPTVDTIKPVISMGEDTLYRTLNPEGIFSDPGVSAFDLTDGNLTSNVVATGEVDLGTAGVYTITYTVADNAGNVQTAVRTVIVSSGGPGTDIKIPVITLLGSDTIQLPEGITIQEFEPTYQEPGYSAEDDRDGTITHKVVVSGFQQLNPKYWYITYDVTDSAGNAAATVRRYFDTGLPETVQLPVIDLIYGDSVIQLIQGSPWEEPGYIASDITDGDITDNVIVDSSNLIDNMATIGTYTIIYEVTNSAGGTARKTRLVSVTDNPYDIVPPVITLLGRNPDTTLAGGTAYVDPGATALDNKDGDLTDQITVSGEVNLKEMGKYTLTYSCKDAAGLRGTATRTVYVVRDTLTTDILIRYTVPTEDPLPSMMNIKFTTVDIDGDGPTALKTDVKAFIINWSLEENAFRQFAMEYNGQPYYKEFSSSVDQTFGKTNPYMKVSNSEVEGLDGEYYVIYDAAAGEFIWVDTKGRFAIIWSE